MGLKYLTLNITYDLNKGFSIDGDVEKERQHDLIAEFLRRQIGKGADNSESNKQNVYHITLKWDLHFGRIEASSDTGNKRLRDGILTEILEKLE